MLWLFSEGEVLEPLRCIHPLLGSRFIISIQGCGCVTSLFHCGLSSDNDHGAESAFFVTADLRSHHRNEYWLEMLLESLGVLENESASYRGVYCAG